jgi:DNA-binding SARP family transcriptional activator
MVNLRVKLFGKLSVKQDGHTIQGIEARKVQELFSYLLIFRNHSQSREILSEILWGDRPQTKSKKYLRQALWRLQLALKEADNSHKLNILAEDDWIQINPAANIWLDIAEFEQCFNSLNDKESHHMTSGDFNIIQSAVKLYRGDLLEGWYQDWCLFERERFQIMYLMLLDKLVQYCELHEHYSAGLAYGTEILRQDHAYERTHRQMMRLYFQAGDRTQALHQYQRCVTALRNELDIEPSESTKELYEQIRSDSFASALAREKTAFQTAMDPVPSLSWMLDRLEHFSNELNQIRYQLKSEAAAFDKPYPNSE